MATERRLRLRGIAAFSVSTPEFTPEELVGVLGALGYDGVEWRVVDQEPSADGRPGFWKGNRATVPLRTFVEDAPRIRRLADEAGLETINVGAYAQCSALDEVEQVLRGTAALGAPTARIRVPGFGPDSSDYRALRDRSRAEFEQVAALARRYGVRALIETHQDTILPSASAVASFLEGMDPRDVGVIHDPGNMVKEGYESYRLGLEALGPYLAHVQLKSARWVADGTRPDGSTAWRSEWASLKAGIVDVGAYVQALAAVGYDGWISFEDFSMDLPIRERLRDNLAYLRGLLA